MEIIYLFQYLFYAQKHLAFLIKQRTKRKIIGIRVPHASPLISHLFFANDRFFFYKKGSCACEKNVKIAKIYGKSSGHISTLKSHFYYSVRESYKM